MIERFIVEEDRLPNKITGYLESNPSIAGHGMRDILFWGARGMLARGYDPDTLLTMRWAGKAFDSFNPQKISVLAKLDSTETDRRGPLIGPYHVPEHWGRE